MTTHTTYDDLKSAIETSSLHIFRENDGDQLILTQSDHSVQPLPQGDRIVSVGVSEDDDGIWFPLSANEYRDAGDYGPNEVEWSALSIGEAVELAKRAFNHEDYDGQPTDE